MPNLKLTKPGFSNYTGQLLGADFVDGVSQGISQTTTDTIAAAVGGVLVDDAGAEVGRAGSFYRRPETAVAPKPDEGE